jgi:aryl-alcohol dehydrogenase-like predicted oxidoreductase
MEKRTLGRSGIELPPLGFGCMQIGGMMRDLESHRRKGSGTDEQSIRALEHALHAGVRPFDTASGYGAGHSERLLGRALRGKGKRAKAIIATKFGKPVDEDRHSFGSYDSERHLIESIRGECEHSLKRLGTDCIDLYQYHQMNYQLVDRADEVLGILESLVLEGKIRAYGWSTENPRCAETFARSSSASSMPTG